ncbi:MAG: diguanylate cyclase [Iodobacter sp.]
MIKITAAKLFCARFWLLCILLTCGHAFAIELSAAEKQAVRQLGTIFFCVDPDWPPFEMLDQQGRYTGIAADLLALVARRTGLNLKLRATPDWSASVKDSKAGRCPLLSFINQTPSREQWLLFTEPLLTDDNVLISRTDFPYITDLASLTETTVALPEGTALEERLRHDFPQLKIVLTQSEKQALQLVSDRKVDITIRSLIMAADTIKHEGWFNLKISGQATGYTNQFKIGVSKDQPILRDILNKGIASITPAERRQIVDDHISINVTRGVDYSLLIKSAIIFIVILLSNLFWIAKLRRANKQLKISSQTDALTGLFNRRHFDTIFDREIARARRFSHPLSVVLMDVDFFKKINDELGHLMGDQILIEVAQLIRQQIRGIDTACRWGGEEFLVICPETNAEQAALLAERILQAIRSHAFSSQRPLTLSAGVACLHQDEAEDALLHRADEALYQSKHGGRNQISVR